MVEALDEGVKHYLLIIAERDLLENTLNGSVKMLMDVLALVDPLSFGRLKTMRDDAHQLAAALGHARKLECTPTRRANGEGRESSA